MGKRPRERVNVVYEEKGERPPKAGRLKRSIMLSISGLSEDPCRPAPSELTCYCYCGFLHANMHGLLDVPGAVKGEGGNIGLVDRRTGA